MQAEARLRYYKGSPQKVRLVADVVRGQGVARALAMLKLTHKRCARDIEKLVRSAVDKLRAELRAVYAQDIHNNIQEIQRPEIEAQLIAESIASQLVRRITFRRAMRRSMENALRFGAQGVKIRCSGRLNGAEIARSEWYQEGRLPLHTLKADIENGFAEAFTTYGAIGVKVWIYKGELHRSKAHRRAL